MEKILDIRKLINKEIEMNNVGLSCIIKSEAAKYPIVVLSTHGQPTNKINEDDLAAVVSKHDTDHGG